MEHSHSVLTFMVASVVPSWWISFFRKTVLYLLFSDVFQGSLLFIIVIKNELIFLEKELKARLLNSVIVSQTAVCQISELKTNGSDNVLLEPFSSIPIYCRPTGRCKAKCVTQQINVTGSGSNPILGETHCLVGNGLKSSIM
jgi:hypothetical protein